VRAIRGLSILFCCVAPVSAQTENPFRVEIDLQQQTAFLIRERRVVMESPISSGRYGHLTETGSFKVLEKELNHHSSIYGKIVDAYGRTLVADADADMKVPRGGRFIPAPMRYFMRFHGADGLHAGYARLSRITRLRADAGRTGDRIFQCSRGPNARASFRPHTANESILSLRSSAAARNLAVVRTADRAAIRT
jgi:hypothetical protein